MDNTLRLAAERRHLWAGWSWTRSDHRPGPDGVTVGEFGGRLTRELDALALAFRSDTFEWGSVGDDAPTVLRHNVRDRVAAGAIRSAQREHAQSEAVTCSPL